MATVGGVRDERQLVPRWRLIREIPDSAELAGDPFVRIDFQIDGSYLRHKIKEWRAKPSIGVAADAVACGVVTRKIAEIREIAEFLLENQDKLPRQVEQLAMHSLSDHSEPKGSKKQEIETINVNDAREKAQSVIRIRRAQIRENPRNALGWLDISRAYASIGMHTQAVFAMNIALGIQPEHRLVLRSATRLFVNLGDLERAHEILTRNARTISDPWLVASELAVANIRDKTPKYIKVARKMAESGKYRPEYITELLGALGTVYFMEGRVRQSRRKFRESLEAPTENAVAQAEWANWHLPTLNLPETKLQLPAAYEVECLRALGEKHWQKSMVECGKWLLDEPFSSHPAILGSFIAIGLIGDPKSAEIYAKIGLQADPRDHALKNNLTVALALQDKLDEADKIFSNNRRLIKGDLNRYIHYATSGLLRFRHGDIERGRELYSQAEARAPKEKKHGY